MVLPSILTRSLLFIHFQRAAGVVSTARIERRVINLIDPSKLA